MAREMVGETGKLLDECARIIYTPGQTSFVDADRAVGEKWTGWLASVMALSAFVVGVLLASLQHHENLVESAPSQDGAQRATGKAEQAPESDHYQQSDDEPRKKRHRVRSDLLEIEKLVDIVHGCSLLLRPRLL